MLLQSADVNPSHVQLSVKLAIKSGISALLFCSHAKWSNFFSLRCSINSVRCVNYCVLKS